jgi:hypothetical protein
LWVRIGSIDSEESGFELDVDIDIILDSGRQFVSFSVLFGIFTGEKPGGGLPVGFGGFYDLFSNNGTIFSADSFRLNNLVWSAHFGNTTESVSLTFQFGTVDFCVKCFILREVTSKGRGNNAGVRARFFPAHSIFQAFKENGDDFRGEFRESFGATVYFAGEG